MVYGHYELWLFDCECDVIILTILCRMLFVFVTFASMLDRARYVRRRPMLCMVCGILGNSLNIVLTVCGFKCFRYFWFQKEGLDVIEHHPLDFYSKLNVYDFTLIFSEYF